MRKVDVLIIGGGPAGMAAAIAAKEAGCGNLLLVDREEKLGGILKQCIHNGFGLHVFKEELTGPEYAQRYIDRVHELSIPYLLNTMVIDVSNERVVTVVNEDGLQMIHAQAIVLCMGCRERPRGALGIPGTRCAGIYSAGTAQRFTNIEGFLPGKSVVILGSGDIGLIMARRMTFEGCEVKAVVELLPYSSGLKRNIVQCLDDYNIPLMLSHTIVHIYGKERLEGVTVAAVDENRQPIPGTEQYFACDTLLLSVGLIPENELSRAAGVELSCATAGPVVDEMLSTNVEGIFACGNVLHVHDLVDHVSRQSAKAGRSAALYALSKTTAPQRFVPVLDGVGVRGCVPQRMHPDRLNEPLTILFRPAAVYKNAYVCIDADGEQIFRKKHAILTPGEMAEVILSRELVEGRDCASITVRIEEQEKGRTI